MKYTSLNQSSMLGNIILQKLSILGLLEPLTWLSYGPDSNSPKSIQLQGYFEELSLNLEDTIPKTRSLAYVKMDTNPTQYDQIIRRVHNKEKKYMILSVRTPILGFKELTLR